MKKVVFSVAVLVAVFLFSNIAEAHPGRADSSGCHTCRTNCSSWGLSTGEYHCHNAKAAPQPIEPIKSHYGDGGTGYTTPAPEYKKPASVPVVNNIQPKIEKPKEQPKEELAKPQEQKPEETKVEIPVASVQENKVADEAIKIYEGRFSGKEKIFMSLFGPVGSMYYFLKGIL